MAENFVIRLFAAPVDASVQAEWMVVDGSGARRSNMQSGTLANAALQTGGRKVTVLVPGMDVLLAEPVLPLKSGTKLAQVVPFALEEQLAADVEDLHFAVGKRDKQPGTPVAVVAHEQMERWQAALQHAGLSADVLCAETSLLPSAATGVALVIEGGHVYVRRESAPGAVVDVEPLIEALQLALASSEQEREDVTIYLSEEDYERERDLLEGLREFTTSLQLKLLPGGVLPMLAANLTQTTPVNLLQGRYASKTQLQFSFAPWRYAAILAGAFIALHLGLQAWRYVHFKKAEAQLDSEIAQVFQQAMPGAPMPSPSNARKQVELRLNQLRGAAPTSGIMATLSVLGEALAQAPNTRLEALSYRNNITELRVTAPSVDALDRIQHTASQRGIDAQIQSASPRDSKIEGRMQFKTPGP
jgi:general secretion pathway protein L